MWEVYLFLGTPFGGLDVIFEVVFRLLTNSFVRMPRANRYHVPGLIWHITHRCHNRDFLFRWNLDRDRYRFWLWEARKRYDLCLLDYTITSNHIHLIVYDSGDPDMIERSLQLTQGRLAQEYNRRKGRLGAFWQDRYHATAIQSGTHLRRCMTYVDMNMVRAGVVAHPADWPSAGYHEIQRPPKRYRLLDLEKMMELIGATSHQELARWQEDRIREAIANRHQREAHWTEAVAVGDDSFLSQVAERLGTRARHKRIVQRDSVSVLEEESGPYRLYLPVKYPV